MMLSSFIGFIIGLIELIVSLITEIVSNEHISIFQSIPIIPFQKSTVFILLPRSFLIIIWEGI